MTSLVIYLHIHLVVLTLLSEGQVIEYVTELTAEQETALIEAGVTDTSGIIVGDMTQEEVDAAVAAAIASSKC